MKSWGKSRPKVFPTVFNNSASTCEEYFDVEASKPYEKMLGEREMRN